MLQSVFLAKNVVFSAPLYIYYGENCKNDEKGAPVYIFMKVFKKVNEFQVKGAPVCIWKKLTV